MSFPPASATAFTTASHPFPSESRIIKHLNIPVRIKTVCLTVYLKVLGPEPLSAFCPLSSPLVSATLTPLYLHPVTFHWCHHTKVSLISIRLSARLSHRLTPSSRSTVTLAAGLHHNRCNPLLLVLLSHCFNFVSSIIYNIFPLL